MSNQLATLGSRFRLARIAAGQIAYSKNNPIALELPNALLAKAILVRITGNLVVGVANAANIFAEAPLGLIKRIEVVADRRKYLVSLSGRDLYRLNHFMHNKAMENSPPAATTGTKAFACTLVIDHEALNFLDASESLFDPRLYKKVELVITWGSETDIATAGGGGGTIAIDAATAASVSVVQTAEGVNQTLFDHSLSFDERSIAASSQALEIEIPQNGLLAGVLIRTDRDAGAGAGPVPVDDLINTISLVSDTTVRHVDRIKWADLQRQNVGDFKLDGAAVLGNQIPGYAYLALDDNHQFSSILNINALNKAKLAFDVTRTSGTEILRVSYDFYEPRVNLAAQVAA